ncbi:30S ribosomal protein S4 [Tissierella praeacuta]|uniref:Small ribosomal subunit protein uS4 n=1 Tax=Tissierella praeacuta DSM 18095 TaxID=1123404 RepID=A0A1M4YA93_9FIRM|nr:30S ribosomal protein S4 [Tissierella praeacuta]MBU5256322.1 30S ribosomal protein S4 [Tissierella praeacuta]TCU69683.1 SSU ribosomal protein S4P [Tissierella praeacuta]SHF02664.1 SSU ribosomal protein S4P [Tissierella praeacuta DSM 18095]SUP03251.1 30S ribosomal protein S4 [Tissierella praeacuta]
MARYTGPVCRLCRREGMKLFLKGDRCYTDQCAINKRNYAPGQHGQSRKKVTEYGMQLREKQKVRRFYGISESQMVKYFIMADKMRGITGENLLKILELRLDNVVYRMGFASSRAEARQLVTHGHFLVNGSKVDIPSVILSVGDVVEIKERTRGSEKIKSLVENHNGNTVKWINVDIDQLKGSIVAEPTREDIDIPVEEHLIVELYSK